MSREILRRLPSVDELLNTATLTQLAEEYSREVIVNAARTVLNELRLEITSDETLPLVTKEANRPGRICQYTIYGAPLGHLAGQGGAREADEDTAELDPRENRQTWCVQFKEALS